MVITAQCLRGPGKDIGPCPQEAFVTTREENLLYGWSKKGGAESVLSIAKLCGSQHPGRETEEEWTAFKSEMLGWVGGERTLQTTEIAFSASGVWKRLGNPKGNLLQLLP